MNTANVPMNALVRKHLDEQLRTRVMHLLFWVIVVMLLIGPVSAHAQSMSGSMPWETFAQKVACSMSGPWVKWLAVTAIALAGIMFGLGELSGPFKRAMEIAGGFSIAVAAVAVVTMILPSSATSGLAGASCSATL